MSRFKHMPNLKKCVKILCLNTNEIFNSQKEVGKNLTLNHQTFLEFVLKNEKVIRV